MHCLSGLLQAFCLQKFDNAMESLNSSHWCNWNRVSRYVIYFLIIFNIKDIVKYLLVSNGHPLSARCSLYSNLSNCTEEISDCLLIPWPNPLVEQTFVGIHSTFFKECPSEELSDPEPFIVFALVITPICLIPVMVSLVVLKTKNGDGSS